MKISVVFVLLATLCLCLVSAQPVVSSVEQSSSLLVQQPELSELQSEEYSQLVVSRSRRATCDLLSFDTPIGSLNHSACAAHCLALGKGFKGGRCIDGVCHCRK